MVLINIFGKTFDTVLFSSFSLICLSIYQLISNNNFFFRIKSKAKMITKRKINYDNDNVHKNKSENEKRYTIVKRKINVKWNKGARETSNVCWFRPKVVASTHKHSTTQHNAAQYTKLQPTESDSKTHNRHSYVRARSIDTPILWALVRSLSIYHQVSLQPQRIRIQLARTHRHNNNICILLLLFMFRVARTCTLIAQC